MNRLSIIISLLMLLIAFACKQTTEPPSLPNDTSSSASFSFTKPAHLSHLISSAQVVVSASDIDTLIVDLTVDSTSVSGTVTEIPAGSNRKFEVFVYDATGVLTYSGEGVTDVVANSVITLEIVLYPINHSGTVIVIGSFEELNYSLSFDGIDDWLSLGDPNILEFGTSDFTISLWFKTERSGEQQVLIRKGYDNRTFGEGRWVIKIFSNNAIKIVLDDIDNGAGSTFASEGTTVVTDGQWHHLAAVFDRDEKLIVYLDGEIEIEDPNLVYNSGSISNTNTINAFMGRAHGEFAFFDGQLDEVRVWNKTRNQDDVIVDMNQQLSGTELGLIAYWKMDEGEGQYLHDSAGNISGVLGNTVNIEIHDPSWLLSNFPYGN